MPMFPTMPRCPETPWSVTSQQIDQDRSQQWERTACRFGQGLRRVRPVDWHFLAQLSQTQYIRTNQGAGLLRQIQHWGWRLGNLFHRDRCRLATETLDVFTDPKYYQNLSKLICALFGLKKTWNNLVEKLCGAKVLLRKHTLCKNDAVWNSLLQKLCGVNGDGFRSMQKKHQKTIFFSCTTAQHERSNTFPSDRSQTLGLHWLIHFWLIRYGSSCQPMATSRTCQANTCGLANRLIGNDRNPCFVFNVQRCSWSGWSNLCFRQLPPGSQERIPVTRENLENFGVCNPA